jgi:transcription elongation factor GreA
MSKVFILKSGFDALKAKLDNLLDIERQKVSDDIGEAIKQGDLRENSEYTAGKEKQRMVEGRINELEQLLNNLQVFDASSVKNKKEVRFGAKCVLVDKKTKKEKTIQIVSEFESDFHKGLISIDATFGKSLLGAKEGETVEIKMGNEKREFMVKKVSY